MKKYLNIIKLLVAFTILTLMFYVSTGEMIFTAAFFTFALVYLFGYAYKKLIRTENYNERIENCVVFINSFIINLSIKNNVLECLDGITPSLPDSLKKEVELYKNDDPILLIDSLRQYFKLEIFDVFSETVSLYSNEGGDPLIMFSQILENVKVLHEKKNETVVEAKKTFTQISLLWGLATLILVVCRFALTDFYSHLLGDLMFSLLVFASYLIALVCYHIFVLRITQTRGLKNEKFK